MNDNKNLDQKFEELLNNLKLSENKKNVLRSYSSDKKMYMLAAQSEEKKYQTPEYYVRLLENYSSAISLDVSKVLECLGSLRVALTNYTVGWTRAFKDEGLGAIFRLLKLTIKMNDETYNKIQEECIKCVFKLNSDHESLIEFLELDEELVILASFVDYKRAPLTISVLQHLIVLCYIDERKVVSAFEKVAELKKWDRFFPIVQGMTMTSDDNLWVASLQFINAVLTQTNNVEFRMFLRNEFLATGLYDVIARLRNHSAEKVKQQFDVFCQTKDNDKLCLQLDACDYKNYYKRYKRRVSGDAFCTSNPPIRPRYRDAST
ncbi:hypothetical protein FQR65_LT00209 [Abscondita terminalis]|nr:hypothetical protein FQR65_LT00209 [Abscondita terminalis]